MTATASSTDTAELVRFILARLDDEDDGVRRRLREQRGVEDTTAAAVIDRLRADVLSRRQVVGSVQQLLVLRDLPNEKAVRDTAVAILRSLATPYAEHSSFREKWHATGR